MYFDFKCHIVVSTIRLCYTYERVQTVAAAPVTHPRTPPVYRPMRPYCYAAILAQTIMLHIRLRPNQKSTFDGHNVVFIGETTIGTGERSPNFWDPLASSLMENADILVRIFIFFASYKPEPRPSQMQRS